MNPITRKWMSWIVANLSRHMESVANVMERDGDEETRQHAVELRGAA